MFGVITCLALSCKDRILSSAGQPATFDTSESAKTSCTNGIRLNYTLPMFTECGTRQHPTDCDKQPCENGWCEETKKGYRCHCPTGFQGRQCNEGSVHGSNNTKTFSITTPTSTSESVTGGRPKQESGGMVFVTDPKAEKIFVAELQDELLFTPIASTLRPRGITYDPVSKKIYWTEGQVRRIVRADINGSNIEIVTKFSSSQYRPGLDDIVVAVNSRTLYVACRRVNRISSVLIAEGSPLPWNQTNFLTEGIVWPRALVVDEEQGYLYWSMENTIARKFLNGSGQIEVIYMNDELQNFTGLTIDIRSSD
ncbi:low-density lipoprotein receptor-related protein 6-like [Lytechinus pictus]|uniref:low-density lipoprotein receptor-related protein 6-like n=1 Tax=Lytechinus pictus TaxID=7653 RepID=UPI0030BA25DE